jgi:hypothetical protein
MSGKEPICVVVIVLCTTLTACLGKQPPRKRTIEAPALSCEEANRLAYRTVTTLGFRIASLQVARPGQPGHIVAEPGRERQQGGRVTITCNEGGAIVEPEKTTLPIPSLLGAAEKPGEFPQMFMQSFNVLRMRKELVAQQAPEQGLVMTMTPLNSFESQMDLGADLPASGVLPIKVEINNNTSRPYTLEVSKVFLQRTGGGGNVAPLLPPPAAGQGKALQMDLTLQPGQSVSGYLFYPAGDYSSARTMLTDKETDEKEGFSIQF